jgi:acyl carrier protein
MPLVERGDPYKTAAVASVRRKQTTGMIDQAEIQQVIRDYIWRHFPAARHKQIDDDDLLIDEAIIDSLGVLDLVAFLEAEYGVKIADEELEVSDFATIRALAQFIQRKLQCESNP